MSEATIPVSITRAEFLNAVKPLLDLLGTTSDSIVASVPIVIDAMGTGSISFVVAAGDVDPVAQVDGRGRPRSILAAAHPQGDAVAGELVHMVRVEIGDF